MRGRLLAAVLWCAAQALVWVTAPVHAQVPGQPPQVPLAEPTLKPSLPTPQPAPQVQPPPDMPLAAPEALPAAPEAAPEATPPSGDQPPLTAAPTEPADPVVAIIRAKLADPAIGKDENADDLAALAAFYAARTAGPLWMTEMGFSAKGQAGAVRNRTRPTIGGSTPPSFDLPPAGELPTSAEAQALAEIKLDLAILKYARYARGGRFTPATISELFDQAPPLRDPKTVLAEIEMTEAPDAYLQSLHPKHEQFAQLRQKLLEARGDERGGRKPGTTRTSSGSSSIWSAGAGCRRSWAAIYVWNNSPEFRLYVVKDGKTIFADKTLVGTIGYATPVFTADMTTIVFNPDWIAPETVVNENILPHLREGNYSILRVHKLFGQLQRQAGGPDQGRLEPGQYL